MISWHWGVDSHSVRQDFPREHNQSHCTSPNLKIVLDIVLFLTLDLINPSPMTNTNQSLRPRPNPSLSISSNSNPNPNP